MSNISNKIVTSVSTLIDDNIDNIENISDNNVVCIDIEQGFIGIHKYNPISQIDVSGIIRCDTLFVNNINVDPNADFNLSEIKRNVLPFINLSGAIGSTTNIWSNAHIRDISLTNISVYENIVPTTISGSLGLSNAYWSNAYIRNISASNISVSGNIVPQVNISGSLNTTSNLGSTNKYWNSAYITSISANAISVSGNIEPLGIGSNNLGSTSKVWSNAYITNISAINISANIIKTSIIGSLTQNEGTLGSSGNYWNTAYITNISANAISISGNIEPLADNANLGSTTKAWSNAYITNISAINISANIIKSHIIASLIENEGTLGSSGNYWSTAYITNISANAISVSGNIEPLADNANLGSTTKAWSNAYITSISAINISANIIKSHIIGSLTQNDGTLGSNGNYWNSAYITNISANAISVSRNIEPLADNANLGSTAKLWTNAYITNISAINISANTIRTSIIASLIENEGTLGSSGNYWNSAYITNISANAISVSENIEPLADIANLGSTTKAWSNAYITNISAINLSANIIRTSIIASLTENDGTLGSSGNYWSTAYLSNISANAISVSRNIEPLADVANLGSTAKAWTNAYITNISGINISANIIRTSIIGSLTQYEGILGSSENYWNSAYISNISANAISVSRNIEPLADNANLGSTTKLWTNAYITNISAINLSANTIRTSIITSLTENEGTLGSSGNYWSTSYISSISANAISISRNIEPYTSLSHSLGSSTNIWLNAYITTISASNISITNINEIPYTNSQNADGTISTNTSLIPSGPNLTIGTSDDYWANAYITNISASNISVSGNVTIDKNLDVSGNLTVLNNVTLGGSILYVPQNFTIDPIGHNNNTGTVIINGNLQVDGTTTTINSSIIDICDITINLASFAQTSQQADRAGFTISGANVSFLYDNNIFKSSIGISISGNINPTNINSHSLGESNKRWGDAHIINISADIITPIGNNKKLGDINNTWTSAHITTINAGAINPIINTTTFIGDVNDSWTNAYITNISASIINSTSTINANTIIPSGNIKNLGTSSSDTWNNAYITNISADTIKPYGTNKNLGTSSSDTWNNAYITNITATTISSNIINANTIIPSGNNKNLGTSEATNTWNNVYITNIIGNTITPLTNTSKSIGGTVASEIWTNAYITNISATTISANTINANSIIPSGGDKNLGGTSALDTWNNAYITNITATTIKPITDTSKNIGGTYASEIWTNAYIINISATIISSLITNEGTLGYSGNYWNTAYLTNISASAISVSGNLEPQYDTNSTNLGSNNKRWANAYITNISATNIIPYTSNGSLGTDSIKFLNSYITNMYSDIIRPFSNGTRSIGVSDSHWKNAFIDDISLTNITPYTNGIGHVGTSQTRWRDGYINNLYSYRLWSNLIDKYIGEDADLKRWPNAFIDNITGNSITPYTTLSGSLGTSSKIWNNAYIQDLSVTNISVSGNLEPLTSNNTTKLGSTTKRWSNAYINTISSTNIDVEAINAISSAILSQFNTTIGDYNLYSELFNLVQSIIPEGTIVAWKPPTGTYPHYSDAPTGWLVCDGSGGLTPDLRGRFILGHYSSSDSRSAGTYNNSSTDIYLSHNTMDLSGGAERVRLNAGNLPPHSHDFSYLAFFQPENTVKVGYAERPPTGFWLQNWSEARFNPPYGSTRWITRKNGANQSNTDDWNTIYDRTVNNTDVYTGISGNNFSGNNLSHQNMPPFYVLKYIMKTALPPIPTPGADFPGFFGVINFISTNSQNVTTFSITAVNTDANRVGLVTNLVAPSNYELTSTNRINKIGSDLSYGLDISINVNLISNSAFTKNLTFTISNYINSAQDTSNSYFSNSLLNYGPITSSVTHLIRLRKIRPQTNGVYLPMTISSAVVETPYSGTFVFYRSGSSNSNYSIAFNSPISYNVLAVGASAEFFVNSITTDESYNIYIRKTNIIVPITQTQWDNTTFTYNSAQLSLTQNMVLTTDGIGNLSIRPLISSSTIIITTNIPFVFIGNIDISNSIQDLQIEIDSTSTNSLAVGSITSLSVTIITNRVFNLYGIVNDSSWNDISFSSNNATISNISTGLVTGSNGAYGSFTFTPTIESTTISLNIFYNQGPTFIRNIDISTNIQNLQIGIDSTNLNSLAVGSTTSLSATIITDTPIYLYGIPNDSSWNDISFSSNNATISNISTGLVTGSNGAYGSFTFTPTIESTTISLNIFYSPIFSGAITIAPLNSPYYINNIVSQINYPSNGQAVIVVTNIFSITIYFEIGKAGLAQSQTAWNAITFSDTTGNSIITRFNDVVSDGTNYYGKLIIAPSMSGLSDIIITVVIAP